MGIEFIHRTIRTSIVLACAIFLSVWLYYDFKFGAGILVGALWGCLNLFAIALVVKVAITSQIAKKKIILSVLFFKFPFIYGIGYIILKLDFFPILSLLAGFTSIFLVMFMKALGQMLMSVRRENQLGSVTK
ncbi:MAG TPA: hypothetical protein VGB16_05125 [candidate division Zixibacteria bacterium]